MPRISTLRWMTSRSTWNEVVGRFPRAYWAVDDPQQLSQTLTASVSVVTADAIFDLYDVKRLWRYGRLLSKTGR